MSRSTRIILAVMAIALFLCCVAGLGVALLGTRLVGRAVITDPDRVATVSSQIADFQIPPGYEQMFASNVAGVKMVALSPADPQAGFMVIMLLQLPAPTGSNQKEMERQMARALAQQTGVGSADLEVTGQEQVTIKGETVALTVRDGTTQDGQTLHQVSGLFPGQGGPTLLVITGLTEDWDQSAVDRFIASIR
jgi:hypothetical protein